MVEEYCKTLTNNLKHLPVQVEVDEKRYFILVLCSDVSENYHTL